MAVLQKELKKGSKGFLVWSLGICFVLVICIFIYPEMKTEMEGMNNIFANMGSFTKAFGLEELNFGTLVGYYGVECGNMLGMGGGLFAAYIGVSVLSKEEKDHTAEFLLTHPISRASVVIQKLMAVIIQIVVMNLAIFVCSVLTVEVIGEELPTKEWVLIHMAYFLLQIEIAVICFGISAFLKRGSIGVGLGLAAMFYFMNLICNISEEAEFLKYITPYAYADSADIVAEMSLDKTLILLGMGYMVVMAVIGFVKYTKKDIAS